MRDRPKPPLPSLTPWENYVLERLDDFEARVRSVERGQWVMAALLVVAAASRFFGPAPLGSSFQFP